MSNFSYTPRHVPSSTSISEFIYYVSSVAHMYVPSSTSISELGYTSMHVQLQEILH